MKSLRTVFRMFALVSMLIGISLSSLANVKIGDEIILPALKDQFEQTQQLQTDTKWLLFAHDMDGTNIARDALDGQTAESMNNAGIQFFADISGMPGLISKFIAMPRLQKLPYSIALARDKEQLVSIPREDDKTTVVKLNEGRIEAITIADSATEIKGMLAL
ncbi:MAG: hypothetical protein AAGJ37_00140 [Pseudomonadota bacterium]